MIVVQDFRMIRDKISRTRFDRLDSIDDRGVKMVDGIRFTWVKINDAINVSLLVQLVSRDAHKFRTFLP